MNHPLLNKVTRLVLASLFILILLAGCSPQPNPNPCDSGEEHRPDNSITGQIGGTVTIGTLCFDKNRYQLGDRVHLTMLVKNALNEPIVLGDGQSPVLDIEIGWAERRLRSKYQPPIPTRLELQPGQTYVLAWDWPPPDVDVTKAKSPEGWLAAEGFWVGLDGARGHVGVTGIAYGPIALGVP